MANVLLSTQRLQIYPNSQDSVTLQITNASAAPILFHLLTTSPTRYTVKHKKGVIQPSSSANAVISLSKSKIPEANNSEEFIKDTFLLEYALVEQHDIIDPTFSNVSDIIKSKKSAGKVTKKQISCRVFLTGEPDKSEERGAAGLESLKSKRQSSKVVSKGRSPLVYVFGVLAAFIAVAALLVSWQK